MSLSAKPAANFTKNVRKRGDDYYCKGRVMIHEGSPSELTACVRGSGFYEVEFAWRDNKLAVWCDCPHFVEQGVPCKHVWANTLAADQHQYLTAAASADKLILDLDALGAVGLDGRDYYDGDEELYGEDGTAPSFHRVLLRSSGVRQSRNNRTGGNNSARSFRIEIARLFIVLTDGIGTVAECID